MPACGFSNASFYIWRANFGEMSVLDAKRFEANVAAVMRMSEELNMLVLRIAQELQPDIPTSFSAWRAKVKDKLLI